MARDHRRYRLVEPSRERPGPYDTLEEAARKTIGVYAHRLRTYARGARGGHDPEALHQMRVAVRQLRANLRLFAGGIPISLLRTLDRELSWLGDRLGAVRDLDVQLARLAERGSANTGNAHKRLVAWLRAERRERRIVLRTALDSSRYDRLLRRLERFLEMPRRRTIIGGESLAQVASTAIEHALRKLRKRGRKVARGTGTDARSLHQLRIRVRRLRYALDALSNLTGGDGRRVIKHLMRLQDLLGAHQDAVVAAQVLRRYRSQASASEAFAAELGASQEQLASDIRGKLREAWRDFMGKRARAECRALLHTLRAQASRTNAGTRVRPHIEVIAMQRTLYLVRHAIAETLAPSGRDADRQLTREGIAKLRRVALGLKRLGVVPDLILSSPLRRAEQTASLLCEVLAPELTVNLCEALSPGHSPEAVLRALPARSNLRQVIFVGHEPDLGQLASFLLTGSPTAAHLPFKKAGAAAIEIASLASGSNGTLCWFMTPAQLRALGGSH